MPVAPAPPVPKLWDVTPTIACAAPFTVQVPLK